MSPLPKTRSTPLRLMKASITAFESLAATRISRSPTVERMRRRLPAGWASTTPFTLFNTLIISCASGYALPNGKRPERRESEAIPSRIAVSDFAPMPGMSRNLPAFAAASNSVSVLMLSVFQINAIFFGPSEGTCSQPAKLSGTSFFNFSRNSSLPVLSNSSIFSAMALPTPGMSANFPSFQYSLASRPSVSKLSAALR